MTEKLTPVVRTPQWPTRELAAIAKALGVEEEA